MHCKALTTEDFDKWTIALRGFIGGTIQETETKGGRVASIGSGILTGNEQSTQNNAMTALEGVADVS